MKKAVAAMVFVVMCAGIALGTAACSLAGTKSSKRTFKSEEGRYSVVYDTSLWKTDSEDNGIDLSLMYNEEEIFCNVNFRINEPEDTVMNAKEGDEDKVEQWYSAFYMDMDNIEIIKIEDVQLAGKSAKKIAVSEKDNEGAEYSGVDYYVVSGDIMYVIVVSCNAGVYTQLQSKIDKVIGQFKITK